MMRRGNWKLILEQIPDLICGDECNFAGQGGEFDGERNERRRGDRRSKNRRGRETRAERESQRNW
jgi:hypothetical protein